MKKKVLTKAQKEKALKRICGKELHDIWDWGIREGKDLMESEMRGTTISPSGAACYRRFKRSLLWCLTRELKAGGVLPL